MSTFQGRLIGWGACGAWKSGTRASGVQAYVHNQRLGVKVRIEQHGKRDRVVVEKIRCVNGQRWSPEKWEAIGKPRMIALGVPALPPWKLVRKAGYPSINAACIAWKLVRPIDTWERRAALREGRRWSTKVPDRLMFYRMVRVLGERIADVAARAEWLDDERHRGALRKLGGEETA